MSKESVITKEVIISKIYTTRGKKVMLDKDLAELYGVTTGNLNKAVSRNLKRFPKDFMFYLKEEEWENLRSQIETSSWGAHVKCPKSLQNRE